jgi:hypothetical protein
MAGYVDPIEPASQLELDVGRPSGYKPQKMRVIDEEAGKRFAEKLETEKEARRVMKEMERDKAIDKAREFVKEGKAAFGPRGGGVGGGSGGAELKSIMNPKAMKKGGKVSSASSRADGIAQRGKTRGRMV